ncbi:hypothetical protein Ancab_004576 [Ancistrocladus abbreviatus]
MERSDLVGSVVSFCVWRQLSRRLLPLGFSTLAITVALVIFFCDLFLLGWRTSSVDCSSLVAARQVLVLICVGKLCRPEGQRVVVADAA